MATNAPTTKARTPATPGIRVEVRNRFTSSWCSGFEISEVVTPTPGASYRIRRLSDGVVLPGSFDEEQVRFVT